MTDTTTTEAAHIIEQAAELLALVGELRDTLEQAVADAYAGRATFDALPDDIEDELDEPELAAQVRSALAALDGVANLTVQDELSDADLELDAVHDALDARHGG